MKKNRIVRAIKPYLPNPVYQTLRGLKKTWGYRGALFLPRLTLWEKLNIVARFVRIDLRVPLAHKPGEIVHVCKTLLERDPRHREVMVEAGCWQGGSTAKFSIICKMMGFPLYVYDSFQGVEATDQEGHDFTGEYAAPLDIVKGHVRKYGELEVCSFFPGWFVDTLAAHPVKEPVRTVFIDCDLAKGTQEALQGVLPSLSDDGVIYTQDYHIAPVKKVLNDPTTWQKLGWSLPAIKHLHHNLAEIHWRQPATEPALESELSA